MWGVLRKWPRLFLFVAFPVHCPLNVYELVRMAKRILAWIEIICLYYRQSQFALFMLGVPKDKAVQILMQLIPKVTFFVLLSYINFTGRVTKVHQFIVFDFSCIISAFEDEPRRML
jgi:hypothetical protein